MPYIKGKFVVCIVIYLTHFMLMFHFFISWGFLMFRTGIEMEHSAKWVKAVLEWAFAWRTSLQSSPFFYLYHEKYLKTARDHRQISLCLLANFKQINGIRFFLKKGKQRKYNLIRLDSLNVKGEIWRPSLRHHYQSLLRILTI